MKPLIPTAVLLAAHLSASAQPALESVLASFDPPNSSFPQANLVEGQDGNFYGAAYGGLYDVGTVFRATPNGEITTLAHFNGSNGAWPNGLSLGIDGNLYGTCGGGVAGNVFQVTTNGTVASWFPFGGAAGEQPEGVLALGPDGNFYGTTAYGGLYEGGIGTAFRVTTNGVLTTLASFSFIGGYSPEAGLTLGLDGNFYGTTYEGGSAGGGGYGTVFRLTPDGTLTPLVAFNNANGANSRAALTLSSDGNFYGTTYRGGSNGKGTVFVVTTEGTLTSLVSFEGPNGANPQASLTFGSDGNLYGTTSAGGDYDQGTIFRVTTNGVLTKLLSFSGPDGASPVGGLTLSRNGNFYGTTSRGGTGGCGTFFRLTSDGTFAMLASFTNGKGRNPTAALTTGKDGNFYGTTTRGGDGDLGTIFKMGTNKTFATLFSFTGNNGANPQANLVVATNGDFYGTTYNGGSSNLGTIFRFTSQGVFSTVFSFTGTNGANPAAGLLLANDGSFYGTTYKGGRSGAGTVFRMTADGELTTLVTFAGANGANPSANLVLGSDGAFYGTTSYGGSKNQGTIFRVTPEGMITQLFSFSGTDGANPAAGVTPGDAGEIYGTTSNGTMYNRGTIFKLTTNGVLSTLITFNGMSGNGGNPKGTLVRCGDGSFFGTTSTGGNSDYGTIFRLTTNGVLTTLHSFKGLNGKNPQAGLLLANDEALYGTTANGGTYGMGTVFRLAVKPSAQSELAQALNTTNLVWASTNAWFVDPVVCHDGKAALGSGPLMWPQQATLQTTVTGPGLLSFWGKVEVYGPNSYLDFYVDGTAQGSIAAFNGWKQILFDAPAGDHTFVWTCWPRPLSGETVWLDEVSWQPAGSPNTQPQTISFNPATEILVTNSPLALSASASSGLGVTFKLLSGPATLENAQLTWTGLGVVTVEADQMGDSLFSPTSVVRTITVRDTNISGFVAVWVAENFPTVPPDQRGLWDVPFGDGVPNLEKFALGVDPLNPTDQTRQIHLSTISEPGVTYATLTFRRRNIALLNYVTEVSGDLKSWYSDPNHVQVVGVTPLDPDFDSVTIKDLTPVSPNAPRFARLRLVAIGD